VSDSRAARRDEVFRKELEEAARKFSRQKISDELWLVRLVDILSPKRIPRLEGYESLAKRLDELDAQRGTRGNRLFYLAAGPDQFPAILENLRKSGLNRTREGAWARVIVEKPFGSDLPSAQALNELVKAAFREADTFRIDHYLGKETAQNMMVLRFANAILNSLERAILTMFRSRRASPWARAARVVQAGALRDMAKTIPPASCLTAMGRRLAWMPTP
jgi:glucose-6-phosphate 1-dehydrogenase